MNRTLSRVLLTILLGVITAPTWSQVCNGNVTATAPDPRYINNGDGTITDLNTGLMWMQCSVGLTTSSIACDTGVLTGYSWQGALGLVDSLNTGGGFAGHMDWRLPNVKELATLVELKCYQPAVNITQFPDVPGTSAEYWSSSPVVAPSVGQAKTFVYDYGHISGKPMTSSYYLRLVRTAY